MFDELVSTRLVLAPGPHMSTASMHPCSKLETLPVCIFSTHTSTNHSLLVFYAYSSLVSWCWIQVGSRSGRLLNISWAASTTPSSSTAQQVKKYCCRCILER
jgi:hypothetical protein